MRFVSFSYTWHGRGTNHADKNDQSMQAAGTSETRNLERSKKRSERATGFIFKKRRQRIGSTNDAPVRSSPTTLPIFSIKYSPAGGIIERNPSPSRQKRQPNIRT